MRLALGEKPRQGGKVSDPVERVRLVHKAGGAQIGGFHKIMPEMLIKPRPPGGAHGIARLQDAAQPRARAAAHQPKMAAMRPRHQFEDDAGLAVALDAKDDSFVDPFHGLIK